MDDWKLKVRTVVKLRECYFASAWTDSQDLLRRGEWRQTAST